MIELDSNRKIFNRNGLAQCEATAIEDNQIIEPHIQREGCTQVVGVSQSRRKVDLDTANECTEESILKIIALKRDSGNEASTFGQTSKIGSSVDLLVTLGRIAENQESCRS